MGWFNQVLLRPANTFPTGLLNKVLNFCKDSELTVQIVDMRTNVNEYTLQPVPDNYSVSDTKDSRDYQVETINKIITSSVQGIPFMRGIVNIATDGGKTTIAEAIIKELYPKLTKNNTNFLFVTHSKEIARQAKKSIEEDVGIDVGFIGDGKWDVKPVTVAIVTTLFSRMKKPAFKQLQETTIGFVADECLSGDSEVLLPGNRTMTIKEICENDSITEVMSFNEEKQILEPKKILRRMITSMSEQFWKVSYKNPITGSTESLLATKNHKIWTENRGYVRVDELTIEDIIKINTSNPEPWNRQGELWYRQGELWYCSDCGQTFISKSSYGGHRASRPQWCKQKIEKFIFNHNVKVESVVQLKNGFIPKFKYNLEVEDNHNYFANNLLVSNCHHSKATSWYEVFSALNNACIRIGLTGTVDKSNPINEMKLYSCTGEILNKISNEYLIDKGYSAKPICILFTVTTPELETEPYQDAYELGIVESEERLSCITEICDKEVSSNNTVLILVEHIEHGHNIQEELEDFIKGCFLQMELCPQTRDKNCLMDLKSIQLMFLFLLQSLMRV